MLTAATLEELATVYQRPIEEFLRHNQERGWALDGRPATSDDKWNASRGYVRTRSVAVYQDDTS
jgi:hypothetical protein